MPVFALYNFNDDTTVVDDAPINGIQNGIYLNGATATGGQAILDGCDDFVKIYPAPQFQMPRGTLEINFTPTGTVTAPQTVLSRDSIGENQGSYRVEINPDGSILVSHETETGTTTFSTGPGFYSSGDTINLSYSWDEAGTGGTLQIENTSTAASYEADVPASLTMNMADQSQPWFIGASQNTSDPDALNNIDEFFQGTVEFFSLSDTVDNLKNPDANPDTATTPEDTPIIIDVLGNDTDPQGQALGIVGVPSATNGTVTVNADGTIRYVPNPDFNGSDIISYTITDPDGNTATSTVTVTVTPANDAPVANPDSSTTPLDTPVTFAVLGNDTDVDGDTLTISGTPSSAQGTVLVNSDGTLTFTPASGFVGLATVDYTIVDAEGLTDTTTWTIAVGDIPVRDGIVSGTTGDDLIDALYVDPTDGDRVDANDALLPGEVGNDDIIRAGDGNDTVLAGDGNDEVEAGTGNDVVSGNGGDDSLDGQAGDDVLDGGEGNDTLLGGDGNDTLTSGAAGIPDRAYPGLNPADPSPNDDRDLVIAGNGDDLVRTGDDADTLFGGTGNDRLESGVDDDTVDGGAGNDTIIAGEGNDTVGGGIGDDLMFGGDGPGGTDPTEVVDATDPDPDNNRDDMSGGAGNDTLYGQDDDDTLAGGSGNDLIFGGIDEDLIYGGSGADDLRGGEGADTIEAGDGNDVVFGQQGNDLIDTSGGTEPLPDAGYPGVYASDTDPDNDRDLVSGGLGDDTIRTGDDADTITGDAGNDLIDAGVDDDVVEAGSGNDTVIGSEGDDTIDGGTGSDLIYGGLDDTIGEALDLPDAVDLRPDNNRDSIRGGAGNDTIFGRDDDDTIDGGAGNDVLDGGIDEDSILGGTGNDTVLGSQGADSASGGDDRDTFLVGAQGAGIGDVINGDEGGDDFDTLDLRGSGPLNIVYDPTNAENGVVTFLDAAGNPTGTLNFTNIENVIPCFTPGTLIATPRGEVPVENLKAGDKVITRDNGIQEIRWVGTRAMTGQELRLNHHLQPIFVKRGSLGNGLPEQDMMVSPNHRLLVANDRTQLYFDEHEVLVAAKHLAGTGGVYAVEAISVTYIHFMFDRHEVVLSNGAWTESFQPGDFTLKGMGNSQRNEIFDLFPELKTQEGLEDYQAARRTLKRHEARLLMK